MAVASKKADWRIPPLCSLHLSNSLLIPSVLLVDISLTPTPPLRRKRSTALLLTGFSLGLLSSTDQGKKGDGKGMFLLTGRNIAYYENLVPTANEAISKRLFAPGKNQHFETFFRGVWIIFPSHPTVHVLLLMKEILHQLIGSLFHCLQGCIHPKWLAAFLPSTVALITSPTHPTDTYPNNNHPKPRCPWMGKRATNGDCWCCRCQSQEWDCRKPWPAIGGNPPTSTPTLPMKAGNENSTVNTKCTTFLGGQSGTLFSRLFS